MNITHAPWLRRLGLAALILLAFALGLALRGGSTETAQQGEAIAAADDVVWTCSMHPQIRMPEPGQCPICGMDLIPLESSDDGRGPRTLELSPAARKRAEIQTTSVVRRSATTTLRMVGKLEAAETRVREIAAWVPGRIDRLYVDYTGVVVRKGDKLFDLYSPELYSTQEELLQSLRASRQLQQSLLESTRSSATPTVDAARERLRLWGLTETQIEEIERRGSPSDYVTILAPMSGVVTHKSAVAGAYVQTGSHIYSIADLSLLWLMVDVYESDLAWVELAQTVTFSTDAYPGDPFTGTVAFIDPLLDERSRSVKVRVEVENPGGRLKPGMFARAVVRAEIDGEGGQPPLVIPASAPLITGTRAVVYVEDPDQPGRYDGREVVLGPRADDLFVVREGLVEGQRVVSNGSFKIDSALQIQAKKSMMSPEGGASPPGHQHGSSPSTAGQPARASDPDRPIAGVPQGFRIQLDDVLARYFEVSKGLSRDSLERAHAAAIELTVSLRAVDHEPLPNVAHARWAEAQRNLESAARAVAAAGSLDVARDAFYDLSTRMIDIVRAFGVSDRTAVFVYHCPMAMDGEGADWLQPTVETENPYYGSQMVTCGSKAETLVAGSDAETGEVHGQH